MEAVVEKWRRLEEEARELRRKEADWEFIESQPPRIKAALKLYIETGDIRLAARVAGIGLEEFREVLRAARVPVVA
uniref:PaREP6 n=1 Tax=Thermofilum pendens TaxID=2269 RepID=A0A7C3SMY2_THEPE